MRRERRGDLAIAAMLALAGLGFGVQATVGRAAFGPFGLVLLAVPGFVISRTVTSRPLAWPELALATLGLTLVLTVLAGVVAALTPRGLDAYSVAVVEIAIVGLAAVAWAMRLRNRRVMPPAVRGRVAPGSVIATAFGLVLALAGYMVAVRAAEDHTYPGFVQFWSVPPAAGSDTLLGLRNATGQPLDCSVGIIRPNEAQLDWPIGAIADGETWAGKLPPADAKNLGPWRILLHCDAADGTSVDRRLLIDRATG